MLFSRQVVSLQLNSQEGGLLIELGWTATGLVDGCSLCGPMPSPYVFIYCKQMTGQS